MSDPAPFYLHDPTSHVGKILLASVILLVPFFCMVVDLGYGSKKYWPSPPQLPLLGSLFLTIGQDFNARCLEWRRKYGPIFSLKLGTSEDFLLVCGAALARELLVINGSSVKSRKAPFFYTKELRLEEYFTPAMTTTPHVLMQRQLLVNTIRMALAQGEGNCLDRASRNLIEKIQSCLNKSPDEPISIYSLLLECSAVCAVNLGFGFRWTLAELRQQQEAREVSELTQGIFGMLEYIHEPTIAFPGLVKLLNSRSERLREQASSLTERLFNSYATLYRLAQSIVENEGEDALEPSVARTLLTSGKTADLSEFEKYCLAGVTMASAITSTSNVINTIVGCLAALPLWKFKAQEEIDKYMKALNDSDEVDLPISGAELGQKLPILKAIMDEALRLFPVFPMLDRIADEDINLSNGKVIEKGKRIFFVYHAINRDKEMFDNPEAFDPDRFLNPSYGSSNQEAKVVWAKYPHSSFSGGRRACPGSDFAMRKAMCFMSRLLYCFDFKFEDGKTGLHRLKPYSAGVETMTHFPPVKFMFRRNISTVSELQGGQ